MTSRYTFTAEQLAALEIIDGGQNVFLTGGPGTGKSYLLRALAEKYGVVGDTAFVAPTGLAASAIGAVTIHSFFGLGNCPYLACFSVQYDYLPPQVLARLRACNRLVIDEVSMVRSDIFNEMDRRMRLAKERDEPFGGCQVVVCGDFHQLPPVVSDPLIGEQMKDDLGGIFAFDTWSWDHLNFRVVKLSTAIRQAEDRDFLNLLNVIREDRPEIVDALARLNSQVRPREESVPVLCCRRNDVRARNQAQLDSLPGEEAVFRARVDFKASPWDTPEIFALVHREPGQDELRIKPGASVMLLRNLDSGANGDMGIVEDWTDSTVNVVLLRDRRRFSVSPVEWPVLMYDLTADGTLVAQHVASIWQFPLALGYATTIHKAQGMTLDRVHIDIGKGCWEPGQLYVALSRVRRLADLTLERPVSYRDLASNALTYRLRELGY